MNVSKLWVLTAGVCQISYEGKTMSVDSRCLAVIARGETILLSLSSLTNSANERGMHLSYSSHTLSCSVIGTLSLVFFFLQHPWQIDHCTLVFKTVPIRMLWYGLFYFFTFPYLLLNNTMYRLHICYMSYRHFA